MCENLLNIKVISSLEKCFYDDNIDSFKPLTSISMLKNEKLSFQIAFRANEEQEKFFGRLKIEGDLKDYISVKQTVCVPNCKPVELAGRHYDENYLRTTPGLYPDLIQNLHYDTDKIVVSAENLRTFWLDINLPADFKAGEYNMKFSITRDDQVYAQTELAITVVDALLPDSDIPHVSQG